MHPWILTKLSYGILKESLLHPRAILELDKTTGKVSYTRATPAHVADGPVPVGGYLSGLPTEVDLDWQYRLERELEPEISEVRRELVKNLTELERALQQRIAELATLQRLQVRLKLPFKEIEVYGQIIEEAQAVAGAVGALARRTQP